LIWCDVFTAAPAVNDVKGNGFSPLLAQHSVPMVITTLIRRTQPPFLWLLLDHWFSRIVSHSL
jgi:hypothetical protein